MVADNALAHSAFVWLARRLDPYDCAVLRSAENLIAGVAKVCFNRPGQGLGNPLFDLLEPTGQSPGQSLEHRPILTKVLRFVQIPRDPITLPTRVAWSGSAAMNSTVEGT